MDREALWWAQAGPSSVLGKIALAVSRKERVVCISTPTPRMSGLKAAIERRLRTELSLDSVSIDLTAEDQSQPIAHMLAGFLDVSAVELDAATRLDADLGDTALVRCAESRVVIVVGREIACRVTAEGGTAGPVDREALVRILDVEGTWELDLTP